MKEYEKLIDALQRARKTVEMLDTDDDGGTCNFDCPLLIMPKGTRESTMQEIGDAAGVYFCKDWHNYADCSAWHIYGDFLRGQGNRRTRIAKIFVNSMNSDGVKCSVYYEID